MGVGVGRGGRARFVSNALRVPHITVKRNLGG